ncbi:MAG: hypothetical protein JXM70_12170 [Pirellulales bacterium]|nr:hypothetical protein [Pirellulales bacterium]
MEVSSITDPNVRIDNSTDAFSDVDMDDFIQLMITELQNQDPLNPMDNEQMLGQIGQIREIASNDKLTESLDALMLSQGITMASNMIGLKVEALSEENQRVEGTVDRVMIEDKKAKLIVTQIVPETYDPLTDTTIAEHTVEHTVLVNNVSKVLNNKPGEIVDPTELPVQLSAAQELIGKSILGMSENNKIVTGEVKRVSLENGAPMLVLTETIPAVYDPQTLEEIRAASTVDHKVSLANISSVLSSNVETTVVN